MRRASTAGVTFPRPRGTNFLDARSIAQPFIPEAWSPRGISKIEARGKFFFAGADKVLLKGVSYGPFAPDEHGVQVPDAA